MNNSTTLDKFIELSKFNIEQYLLDRISNVIHQGGKEYELAILLHELIEETNSGIQTHSKASLIAINTTMHLGIDVEFTTVDDTDQFKGNR